jgi:hypothetical protein
MGLSLYFEFIGECQVTINYPDWNSFSFFSSHLLSKRRSHLFSHFNNDKFTMDGALAEILQYSVAEIITWVINVDIRDHNGSLRRTTGELGFEVQTEVLGIPPRFGIFSPGPSFLQTCEAFFFVRLVSFTIVLPLLLGIAAWLGASHATLGWIVALPFAALAAAWIFFCVVRMPCALLLSSVVFLLI